MVRRNASTIPTCIRPLEEFKRILVLIDGDAYDAARVAANVEDFFISRGKELTVLAGLPLIYFPALCARNSGLPREKTAMKTCSSP